MSIANHVTKTAGVHLQQFNVNVYKTIRIAATLIVRCANLCLHLAVVEGRFDSHSPILKRFVDPNIPSQCGRTPLHCAAEFGELHIVKYLTN